MPAASLTTHYSEIDVAQGATGGTAVLGIGTIEFGGPTTTARAVLTINQFYGSSLILDNFSALQRRHQRLRQGQSL